MGSKDLFFEVEQCYNAPLTTGQINELEREIFHYNLKQRNILSGDYTETCRVQSQAVTTAPTAPPKRENKNRYLAIFERYEKNNEKVVFVVKWSKSPSKIAKAEQMRENALKMLQKSNPNKEYQLGEYRATDSEISDINGKLNS